MQELCFFNSLRLFRPLLIDYMCVKMYVCKNVCKNVFQKKAIDSRTLILAEYSSAGIKSLSWLRAVLDDASLYRLKLSLAERDD